MTASGETEAVGVPAPGHDAEAPGATSAAAEAITLDGPAGRLAVAVHGTLRADAEPILFVHPANLRGACWSDLAARLADERACVAPDLRGHGESERRGPMSVADWADDCWAVVQALDLDRVHLVGGSVGGAIVVALAARLPDRVVTVTTLGGAFLPAPEADAPLLDAIDVHGVASALRDATVEALAPGVPTALAARVEADVSRNDAATVRAIWRAANATDARPLVAALRAPCLAVVGEHDRTCPPDESAWLAAATGGELRVLPGVGHLPMYEAPEAVAALLATHAMTPRSTDP